MVALGSLIVIIVSVYFLAIITEEFFVISLDAVSQRFSIPSDVAGASLMAIGSSAPELFIALIAVFTGGDHADVGIGTIVGSAVFNILVITGASAVIAEKMVMAKGAIERDIIIYLVSVGVLLFVFWDGTIVLWEAVLMMVVYFGYLALLYFWSRSHPETYEEKEEVSADLTSGKGLFATLSEIIAKGFALVIGDPKKNYVRGMLISIAVIAGLSFILVEAAVELSAAIGLPPLIVSLTLLAAGTSAPDLIASIDVARDGRGTMAVSNAVGSNIFDVLVGLGLPWIVAITLLSQSTVAVGTDGLIESVFVLIGTVVLLYILITIKRQLTRGEGFILLAAYVAFIVYSVMTSM
ncbi:MAG: calcium/sodium antiporter [Chloroflexota bacterium]